jgi:inositol-phosphate phosphatase / L-galactose 1-phosphate phosphatase / histidinol-phosphatase
VERASELVGFAQELADIAGTVLRRHFRRPIAVDYKPDQSPVSIADREAETAMREAIRARFPEHGIAGEEFGVERPDAELVWHIDPIDGTKSFLIGRPQFGILIGLAERGRLALGVIDQPILRERWVGAEGMPTTFQGEAVRTRACAELSDAILCTTSPLMFKQPGEPEAFRRIERRVRYTVYGGDCYGYGLLALGLVDLIVEADLDPYDFSALVPVVTGAGGVITDWQGRALTRDSVGQVVAAGDARVHGAALARLAEV